MPVAGEVSGRLFVDSIPNASYDPGEETLSGLTVYLDDNGNAVRDADELLAETDIDGNYRFLDVPSFSSHTIRVEVPISLPWSQVSPAAGDAFAWEIFVPPAGSITERDFAFRRVEAVGQSNDSAVSGRLYQDQNRNGEFDAGIDLPIAGREIYLDTSNFGVRDLNEPRVLTDDQGFYSITDLGTRTVSVSTVLDETLEHVTPIGNQFDVDTYPLFESVTAFGNPQAIGSDDFDGDGFLDVAVALSEGNTLSLRMNDRAGGFLSQEVDVDLGIGGAGANAMVIGQFDDNPQLDVALTASLAGNVVVLLNFDSTTYSFASRHYVEVGSEPQDLASGQFGGDSAIDLAVVNRDDHSVQLLINDGRGAFTPTAPVATGGKRPVSLVAGDFTGDFLTDVVVVHAATGDR